MQTFDPFRDMFLRTADGVRMHEAGRTALLLAEDAIVGLQQALSGQFVSDDELDEALGVQPGR